MGVALERGDADQADSEGGNEDDGHHGKDGYRGKYGCHKEDTFLVSPCRRDHEQGDEGLAGPEDEDRKQYPWRQLAVGLRMRVEMLIVVGVRVIVSISTLTKEMLL